jgi:TIGR02453 family protein
MTPRFSPHTIRFLRSLKRNNNREWFKARKEQYDQCVRGPMVDVIAQLAADFRRIAPELVASPQQSMYRIYRDTRFSENKTPLKTHIAAGFPWKGLPRHEGAGLYFEVAADWVWAGGGMWAPQPPQLHRVREHISTTYPEIQRISRTSSFRRHVGVLEGDRLTRVPRGFDKDDPAAEYLKHYRFVAGREFPASLATSAEFYPTLLRTFKALMPLVRFLNEPLVSFELPVSSFQLSQTNDKLRAGSW